MLERQTDAPCTAWKSESGQTLAEYALILALLVVFVIGAVTLFGDQLHEMFSTIGSGFEKVLP